MSKIVATRKDSNGKIMEVKLDDNREMSIDEAIDLCISKDIEGVVVNYSKFGDAYLRGVGDGDVTNNLDNLPLF